MDGKYHRMEEFVFRITNKHMRLKVKSFTDVITNSSNETFCMKMDDPFYDFMKQMAEKIGLSITEYDTDKIINDLIEGNEQLPYELSERSPYEYPCESISNEDDRFASEAKLMKGYAIFYGDYDNMFLGNDNLTDDENKHLLVYLSTKYFINHNLCNETIQVLFPTKDAMLNHIVAELDNEAKVKRACFIRENGIAEIIDFKSDEHIKTLFNYYTTARKATDEQIAKLNNTYNDEKT